MPRWPTGPFELHRTGCYGCVRSSASDGACGVAGYPCRHWGMDLFAGSRQVVAPEGGEVVAVSDGISAPWVGYGPAVVVIKGNGGKFLLMGHLERGSVVVSKGQRVTEGAPIGRFDSSYGHTHFEVRKELTGPSATNTIDPQTWVRGLSLLALAALGVASYLAVRWIKTGESR